MNVPENIIIFIGIALILSLLANAALIGLLVAYVNNERDIRMRDFDRRNKRE